MMSIDYDKGLHRNTDLPESTLYAGKKAEIL